MREKCNSTQSFASELDALKAFTNEIGSLVSEWDGRISEIEADDEAELDRQNSSEVDLDERPDRPLTSDELAELSHAEWENDKRNGVYGDID